MTDKEKIKEEIEKQIDYAEDDTRYTESYREGLIAAYQTIKAFIDSLPEESASEDWKEDSSFEKILQEIYIKYDKKISIESLLDIASHFAEWGRNHFEDKSEMVSEDLEEYAKKLTKGAALDKHNLIWMCKKGAEWQKQHMKEALQTEYEKGRFDMREEMMKNTVEGVIDIRKWPAKAQVEFYDRLPVFNVRTGDKVKIIIV